nr:hypothetical protein [Streptomyces sp. ISL-99]
MRCQQGADGSWPLVFEGAGHLGTTIQAYVALRLAGDSPHEEHMLRCAAWVREQGGVAASQLTARVWLAMFGRWDWNDLPVVPPETTVLPKWAPLNIYSFSAIMRLALVSLSIISAQSLCVRLPSASTSSLLHPTLPCAGRRQHRSAAGRRSFSI